MSWVVERTPPFHNRHKCCDFTEPVPDHVLPGTVARWGTPEAERMLKIADDYRAWVDDYSVTPELVSWIQANAIPAPLLYRGMFFDNAEEREAWTARWVSGQGYTTLADGFSGVEAYSVERRVADKIANTTAENYEDGVGVVFQVEGLRAADMSPLADWFKSEREWLVADRQRVTFDHWEDSPDGTIRTFYGHVTDPKLESVVPAAGSTQGGGTPGELGC